jgi:hypothetical protein
LIPLEINYEDICISWKPEVKECVDSNPYVMLKFRNYDTVRKIPYLAEFGHNLKFCELVKDFPVLSSEKEGFDLLEHVKVKNWLRFYTFFISFYIDSKNYKAIIPNSIATLSGWNGNPIECEVV